MYFDVVAIVATRHLARANPGREQNSMARDSYSYLHFPMVAGIVLIAFGIKTTLAHESDPLQIVAAVGLYGGATLPEYRGRGLYRATVAKRAALARERGYRYLQVDALPTSRPILERTGFVQLTTTTPYLVSRDPAASSSG
jgi:low temperature requirement protein LtrA